MDKLNEIIKKTAVRKTNSFPNAIPVTFHALQSVATPVLTMFGSKRDPHIHVSNPFPTRTNENKPAITVKK